MSDGQQPSAIRFSIAKLLVLTAAVGVIVGIARLIGKEYSIMVFAIAYLFGPLTAVGVATLFARSKRSRGMIVKTVLIVFLLSHATLIFAHRGFDIGKFHGLLDAIMATACFWTFQWIIMSPVQSRWHE